jgi:hypothetical protein
MEENVGQAATAAATSTAIVPKEARKKKFMNGWTKPQEELMATWGDIAACYRWMHDKADKHFTFLNMSMSIPIIILSTLTGTANFGIDSIVGDNPTHKKYASFVIGSVSLIAGILGTLSNFLRFAQYQESHRVAGVSWGKFQRLIAVELAIHPNDRADCMDFLKICRAELDRLIEQSPAIPTSIVHAFEKKFGKIESIQKPEICGDIDHTQVFRDTEGRLRQVAADAAMFLRQRKKFMNELINEEIERKIKTELDARMRTINIHKEVVEVPEEKEESHAAVINIITPPSSPVSTQHKPRNTLLDIIGQDEEKIEGGEAEKK